MNTNYVISKGVYYIMKNYKNILKNYIKNNYKEYILVCLLFIIGLFIGVMIINNISESKITEIKTYISYIISGYQEIDNIDRVEFLKQLIKNNVLIAIVLWLAGTTIIGMPMVLIIIFFRGIMLGITISSVIITLGTLKGIVFNLIALSIHDLLYIISVLTIGVSSVKLYRSLIENKRKDNIKIEILRHTVVSIIMVMLLVLSACIENFIIFKFLKKIIKYF